VVACEHGCELRCGGNFMAVHTEGSSMTSADTPAGSAPAVLVRIEPATTRRARWSPPSSWRSAR
jgi:hypothetical protein